MALNVKKGIQVPEQTTPATATGGEPVAVPEGDGLVRPELGRGGDQPVRGQNHGRVDRPVEPGGQRRVD
jgi:hypothetical protein